MRTVIHKTVELPSSPESLFEMYLDSAAHSAITGMEAKVVAENDSDFSAFGGLLTGRILRVVRPSLVVQSWRSVSFHDEDPDSTVVISISPAEVGGRIDLIHLDVPDHDYEGVKRGWDEKYFEPWRRYLEDQ